MLKGFGMVCFGEDWGRYPTSTQYLIKVFAKHNKVLWVNSIAIRPPTVTASDLSRLVNKLMNWLRQPRTKYPNVRVLSPLVIPFHQWKFVRRINRYLLTLAVGRILKKQGIISPILWISLPTAVDMVGRIGESVSLYYCFDELSEYPGARTATIVEMENQLLEKVDIVITVSKRLFNSKQGKNRNAFLVSHGVEFEHFNRARDRTLQIPNDMSSIPKPVIGFYGRLDERVDWELIAFLARRRPHWSIVLIGNVVVNVEKLNQLKNIHLIGPKRYEDLPAYSKAFDVAIIPYKPVHRFVVHINPLKVLEYLASGIPVVSTNIPEVSSLYGSVVRVTKSNEDFLAAISSFLERTHEDYIMKGMNLAKEQSWEKKAEEISQHISKLV